MTVIIDWRQWPVINSLRIPMCFQHTVVDTRGHLYTMTSCYIFQVILHSSIKKKNTPIVYNDLILEVDRPNILGMQDINLYLTKNKNKNKQDQIQKNVVLY